MKLFQILLLAVVFVSCGEAEDKGEEKSEEEKKTEQTDLPKETVEVGAGESAIVANFLNDVNSLSNVSSDPIGSFKTAAFESADKSVSVTGEGIATFLEDAKLYKHCVITTGDHTIVKITSFDDCKQSGSWGACMPMAEGFIKKGELVAQKDYINNIIGQPDDQDRVAFLFY